MEATQLETLESYVKTNNDHWNTFAYAQHCKAIEQGLFADPARPLQFIDWAVQFFEQEHERPTNAVHVFLSKVAEAGLTVSQQLFIFKGIDDYINKSEFNRDLTISQALLESYAKKLKQENTPVKPLVGNIRETLKALIEKELKELPQTLKDMEPEKRLNVVCKLIPYVLPKVEAVHSESGEPGSWS